MYPVSSVKERYRYGGKCKISWVLQSAVSSPQASPKVEASDRPKQAQHFSTLETPESIRTSLIPDEWVSSIDLSDAYIHIPIHPNYGFAMILRCSSSPPFGPSSLYKDCTGSEADGPHKGSRTSIPGRLAVQGPVPGGGTSEHSDCCRPETVLRVDNQSRDSELKLKSKHVLTARCLMSLIGLLASTEKMVPEGRFHMRPFQFHLKEHWRYPQSLDNLRPWSETISTHLVAGG